MTARRTQALLSPAMPVSPPSTPSEFEAEGEQDEVLEQLIELYREQNGKEPTDEEVRLEQFRTRA